MVGEITAHKAQCKHYVIHFETKGTVYTYLLYSNDKNIRLAKSLHQGGMVIPRLDNFVYYCVSSYYQTLEWKVNYSSICSRCGYGNMYSGVFLWMRLSFQYISILSIISDQIQNVPVPQPHSQASCDICVI